MGEEKFVSGTPSHSLANVNSLLGSWWISAPWACVGKCAFPSSSLCLLITQVIGELVSPDTLSHQSGLDEVERQEGKCGGHHGSTSASVEMRPMVGCKRGMLIWQLRDSAWRLWNLSVSTEIIHGRRVLQDLTFPFVADSWLSCSPGDFEEGVERLLFSHPLTFERQLH